MFRVVSCLGLKVSRSLCCLMLWPAGSYGRLFCQHERQTRVRGLLGGFVGFKGQELQVSHCSKEGVHCKHQCLATLLVLLLQLSTLLLVSLILITLISVIATGSSCCWCW